jgi:hypothetical protein
MLILIAAVNSRNTESPFTRDKLKEMLGGKLEGDASHARNTQFELYVDALFANGGFTVKGGSGDGRLLYLGETFTIESKRVTSLNLDTLRGTFSHAATQITGPAGTGIIQQVRSRGLIAVNADSYFESVDPSAPRTDLIAQFQDRLRVLDGEARVLEDRTGIIGLLTCGYVAEWKREGNPEHWRLNTLFPMRWMGLFGEDPTEAALARAFQEPMDRVVAKALALRTKMPKPIRID